MSRKRLDEDNEEIGAWMLRAFSEDVRKCLAFVDTRESLEMAADTHMRGL